MKMNIELMTFSSEEGEQSRKQNNVHNTVYDFGVGEVAQDKIKPLAAVWMA
jgi:hypothetical protein